MGFKDTGCTFPVSAEIGRRYPVLSFVGEDVIDDIKELKDLNSKTVFFVDLAKKGFLKCFAELDGAAGNFPFFALVAGVLSASCKKKFTFVIEDDGSNANSDIIDTRLHEP